MPKNVEIENFKLCKQCQALADAGAENAKSAKWVTENFCYNCMRCVKIYNEHFIDLYERMKILPQEYSVTKDTKKGILTIKIIRPVKLTISMDITKKRFEEKYRIGQKDIFIEWMDKTN